MRIDAISLAHLCRSDARDFPCAHGKKDCGPIGGELEGITVSTGNENGSAPLFFRGGSGGQKIIRLEARRLCILKTACRNKLGQYMELFDQRIVEFAGTLVFRKLFMPIGANLSVSHATSTARGSSSRCSRNSMFAKPTMAPACFRPRLRIVFGRA